MVLEGLPIPEPLLHLLKDEEKKPSATTRRGQRRSRDGPRKKEIQNLGVEVISCRSLKISTSCPDCSSTMVIELVQVDYVVVSAVMSGGEVLLRITISGAPGSGTSTLVRKIQHTTGWSALNGGEVFEQKLNVEITVGEFGELCKQDLDVDRSLDRLLKIQ